MAETKWYTKRSIGLGGAADSQDSLAVYKVLYHAGRPMTVAEIAEKTERSEAEVAAILQTKYYQDHYGFTQGDEIPWPPLIEGQETKDKAAEEEAAVEATEEA